MTTLILNFIELNGFTSFHLDAIINIIAKYAKSLNSLKLSTKVPISNQFALTFN